MTRAWGIPKVAKSVRSRCNPLLMQSRPSWNFECQEKGSALGELSILCRDIACAKYSQSNILSGAGTRQGLSRRTLTI
jgi:hypothetical protein